MSQKQLKVKTQIIDISSLNNSLNGSYNSICTSNITADLTDDSVQNVYLGIQHCQIPNSFYIINYTNNTLTINGVTKSLTRGNYNALTLATEINVQFPTIAVTYSKITNKFTFTDSTADFTISSLSTCRYAIGLGNTDITSVSKIAIMPQCLNLYPTPIINLRSKDLSFGNSDVLLSIMNTANTTGVIQYTNVSNLKYTITKQQKLSNFELRVTDDQNNPLNLNGLGFYVTFVLEIQYLEDVPLSFYELLQTV